jgi:hypothetical protein
MIIKFKQSYEEKLPNAIICEQIQGVVSTIVFQEKIFEATDAINEDIIFDLSGRQYSLNKIKNMKIIMKDNDGKDKLFELEKNDLNGKWEMNGTVYSSLKELYYDLNI